MSCAICFREDYSFRVIPNFKKCVCVNVLCFDCIRGEKLKCPTCNEVAEKFAIDRNNGICNERDEKYGPFKCPSCNEPIKRRDYFEHKKTHFCENCKRPDCKKVDSECGGVFACQFNTNHISRCKQCRESICQWCFERLDDGKHKTLKCPCDKFHNYACVEKGQISTFEECVVRRKSNGESYTFDLTQFCSGCGFKCRYQHKCSECDMVQLIRYILQNDVEDKKEYERHQQFREKLINSPFDEFELIEPKKRKEPSESNNSKSDNNEGPDEAPNETSSKKSSRLEE